MKTSTLKRYSVPTNGFRSRGESEFADWLDLWKIPFLYEAETFDVAGQWYVPDFILPDGQIIVEIKPALFNDELWKIRFMAEVLEHQGHGTECWIVEMRWDKTERKHTPFVTDRYMPGKECGWLCGNQQDWIWCCNCLRPFPLHYQTGHCPHCRFTENYSPSGDRWFMPDPIGKPTRSIADCQVDSTKIDTELKKTYARTIANEAEGQKRLQAYLKMERAFPDP